MGVYLSKTFATPEEFEAWIKANEHKNKSFLDNICEQDKQRWDTKACRMTVKDGKLQLLCEQGNVLAEANYYQPDNDTVSCDGTGTLCIHGIKNANDPDGKKFRIWVGTQAEYNAIRVKDPKTLYFITDETTLDDIVLSISNIIDGTTKVKNAENAENAENADSINCYDINSIEDLNTVVTAYGTCGVDFKKAVTIGGISFPAKSKGMLSGQNNHSALIAVDVQGNIYTVYRDYGVWGVAKKIKQKPDEATKADTAAKADSAVTAGIADSAVTAGIADSINCYDINSIEDLNTVVTACGTCGVDFKKAVTIGGISFPAKSKGMLSGQNNRSALIAVDVQGNIYTVYRDYGVWGAAKKIKQKPDEATKADTATKLEYGGAIFGRQLLKKFTAKDESAKIPNDNTQKTITLDSTTKIDEFLIVEISAYDTNSGALLLRFRTNPFYSKYTATKTMECRYRHITEIYKDSFESIDFYVEYDDYNGTRLFVKRNSHNMSMDRQFYVSAIYKEISDATFS